MEVSPEAFSLKINFPASAFGSLYQSTLALTLPRHCYSHEIYNDLNKEIMYLPLVAVVVSVLNQASSSPLCLSSLIRIAHQLLLPAGVRGLLGLQVQRNSPFLRWAKLCVGR